MTQLSIKDQTNKIFFFLLVIALSTNLYSQRKDVQSILSELDNTLNLAYSNRISKEAKIDSLEKYFTKLNVIKNDSSRLRNRFKIINRFVSLKVDSLEIKYINEIKHEALKINNKYNLAKSYDYLGSYFLREFTLDSALYYLNKSEKIFLKKHNTQYLSFNYSSKAKIYDYINDYNKSLDYSFKALKQARILENPRSALFAYQNIFTTLGKLDQQNEAFKYYQKASDVLERNKQELGEYYFSYKAQNQNNMGSVYLKTDKYTKAQKLYQKGLEVKQIKNIFPSLHAALLDNLTYTRYKSGNSKNVEQNLEKALFLKDSLEKPAIAVQTRLRLAEWHFNQNELAKSRRYAQQAYNDAQKHNIIDEELQALEQLAKSDSENQSTHFEEYIRIKDSLIAQERITRNKFARIEYETQEVEKQNALTQLENERLLREKTEVIVGSAFIIVVVGFIYVNNRKKAREKLLLARQSEQQTKEEIMDLILDQQKQLTQVKQQEQNRISKDLHDDVSGNLSSLHLQMHIFQRKKLQQSNGEYQGFMNNLKKLQERIREISHDLKNDREFDHIDFSLAIKAVIQPLNDLGVKTDINYINSFSWSAIPTAVKVELFRILQESVTNTVKYAQANAFTVEFNLENSLFSMQIRDDGKGFDMNNSSKGIGLKNMKERAQHINGEFCLNSGVGKGTSVRLSIPLEKAKKEELV